MSMREIGLIYSCNYFQLTQFLKKNRKDVVVPIIVKNVYAKDVVFYFTLGEPKLVRGSLLHRYSD